MLIGVVALMFLGPRKMPEMARKMGKFMSDFRSTTNEFKSTWEKEVNFEEEERMMRSGEVVSGSPPAPSIREATPEMVQVLARSTEAGTGESLPPGVATGPADPKRLPTDTTEDSPEQELLSDKRTWL